MTLDEIRKKYPQYDDMDDKSLVDSLYKANYSDMDRAEFDKKIGLKEVADPAPAPYVPIPSPQGMPTGGGDARKQRLQQLDADLSEATTGVQKAVVSGAEAVGDFASENKGAIVGTIAGTPLGPPGMITGGAVGTIYDELERQGLKGEDRDVAAALTQGAISVGIDITTLGLGKFIGKPIWAWAKARMLAGDDAAKIVQQVIKEGGEGVANVGTNVARAESQAIAAQANASLSRHQTGLGNALSDTLESIGRIGVVSRGVYEEGRQKVVGVVADRMNKIVGDEALDHASIGYGLQQVYTAGKEAAGKVYNIQLDRLKKDIGNDAISYEPVAKALSNWSKIPRNKDAIGGTKLTKVETDAVEEIQGYMTAKRGPAGFLLDVDEKVKAVMEQALKDAPDSKAYRRLTQLQKRVKSAIVLNMKDIKTTGANTLGMQYRRLNKDYRRSIGALMPEINEKFFLNTNTQGMESLGKMFAQGGTSENINAAMKMIDKSYKLMSPDVKKTLPFRNPQEARRAVAQSYAEKRLGMLSSDSLDPKKFAKEAERLTNKTYAETAKAALGKHYGSYKRTVNLMAHASENPKAGMFGLVIRGKELGTAGKLASAVGKKAVVGLSALGAMGGIFVTPWVMARIAMNPKHVNKLIAINKLGPGKELKKTKMATVLLNDIGYKFPEKEEVKGE